MTSDPAGEPMLAICTVKDTNGQPISGVKIDIWETDSSGHYDVQHDDRGEPSERCVMESDEEGRFWFKQFQKAISSEAPESDGGLVAGWGQVEFEHGGVTSRRFTCLIGWKSVEAHYACKLTAPFTENIHWLMENGHVGVEMVHYAFKAI